MFRSLFNNLTEAEKNAAIENIVKHASPRPDFFLMLVLSVSIAVFGVLLNSTVILIASMLIAPMLYPLVALALGISAADDKLIGRALYTLVKSVAYCLGASFVISLLFAGAGAETVSLGIEAGGSGSYMFAIVAVIAGLAAAFAMTKPQLNETLPGVAIATTLVPPLAIAGIGLSRLDWGMISNALLLFLVNVIGIMFASLIVFSLLRFSLKRSVTQEAVKEEVQEAEREIRRAKSDA
jgi:uncharacterized hydrophobic protein (TIGR00271 family)